MTDLTAALVERDGACRARDAQLILGPCEGPSETVAIHSTLETAPLLRDGHHEVVRAALPASP